jgi:hypothetical protein
MRNLEILTKSIDTLKNLEDNELVTKSCIDEYAKMLIVYTSKHRLLIFTYQDSFSAKTTFKHSVTLSDENPNLENSYLLQLDYIQELQGVQFTYACGNMYLYRVDK